jgi:ABC-type nickel/cobalt efflux system permease component RcnA
MTALSFVLLGFFLGMRHATDADHVIAMSTIVARMRTLRGCVLMGALWGVGHTVTILLVGGALVAFSTVIPPRLGLTMEMTAALMLVALGLWNLAGVLQHVRSCAGETSLHAHPHQHGDYVHSHGHGHGADDHGHREDETPQAWLDRRLGGLGVYQLLRPLVVGVVHGLGGSAALALLVLPTIPQPAWAIAYLGLFGAGTVVGMVLMTAAIAAPLAYASRRFTRLERHVRVASGLASLALGLVLAYRIGFVHGLFTADPRWAPD